MGEGWFFMGVISILFYGNLNDFLPLERKNRRIQVVFAHKTALKHVIESLGVPHPEVGTMHANSNQVGLAYYIQDQDRMDVFPHTATVFASARNQPAFILDNHLGKLTGYLRFLGIDSLYNPTWGDADLANFAAQYRRILLTRDRGLLKRKIITHGYYLRSQLPLDQIAEVVQHFQLSPYIKPFYRCSRCNGILQIVEKERIMDHLQPLTRQYFYEFTHCNGCGRIYWKGSHYPKLIKLISRFCGSFSNSPIK